jgi:hypothetical protein
MIERKKEPEHVHELPARPFPSPARMLLDLSFPPSSGKISREPAFSPLLLSPSSNQQS